jgi:hypothetical protein
MPGIVATTFRAEDLAQRRDLRRKVVLLDDQSGPDDIEELVLGDDSLAPVDQRDQDVEGSRAENWQARHRPSIRLSTGSTSALPKRCDSDTSDS